MLKFNMPTMLSPMMAMILLYILVWVYMYIRRLSYMKMMKIDPQHFHVATEKPKFMPPEVMYSNYNFINLTEVPTIFFVISFASIYLLKFDEMFLKLSWVYVALRYLHSLIHCTYNTVVHRATAYILSCLVLWVMFFRMAAQVYMK
jgi:hypothetical protein